MSDFTIVSAQLQAGDAQPVCGVSLEPYVKARRNNVEGTLPVAEEDALEGQPVDGTNAFALRYRWLRSPDTAENGKGNVCHIHPDRIATNFCGFWKSEYSMYGYPFSYACHCSLDCFKQHWKLQLSYWEKAQDAKKKSAEGNRESSGTQRGTGSVAGPGSENTWTVVCKTKKYMPSKMDIGHRLQFRVVIANRRTGQEVPDSHKSLTTKPVRRVPEPMLRRMVPLGPPVPPHVQKGRFTVLTYNILAELYATHQAHPTSETHALRWEYRRQMILKELAMYDADIVCLQEVQSTSFQEDLKPEMDKRGFDAVFKKKTQDDMLMNGGRYAMDGCATFYRRDRFTLVKKYEVEFNKAAQSFADSMDTGSEHRKTVNRLMKHNVALILVLEGVQPQPQPQSDGNRRWLVCVANTHIHANQDLADVKLWQVHTLLKGLEKIANSANIPMVVAGDLNSVPGSAPHTLMMEQRVDQSHRDLQNDPLQLFTGDGSVNRLMHTLQLRSAYAAAATSTMRSEDLAVLRSRLDDRHHEPLCTNVTHDFRETLDYIVYSSQALHPTALLELPSMQDTLGADQSSGLPNAQWPSDHVALMTEFQFTSMQH